MTEVMNDQLWDGDWAMRGACSRGNPDDLFVQGAEQNRAKAVCMGCAVRTECEPDMCGLLLKPVVELIADLDGRSHLRRIAEASTEGTD